MRILSFVIWIPIFAYILLLFLAVVSVILTTTGIIVVSAIAAAAGLYVIKLYHRHFTPEIWLWKIKRWWWFMKHRW